MAATAARGLGAVCPKRLRAQCTRQRWRPALKTRRAAALRPLWSSAMTSLTPRRPRSASVRRNSVQNASASEAPVATPRTIDGRGAVDPIPGGAAAKRPRRAPAVGVDGDSDDHGDTDDAPALAGFEAGRVDPEVGPMAIDPLQRVDPIPEGSAARRRRRRSAATGTPAHARACPPAARGPTGGISSHRRETWLPRVRLRRPEDMLGDAGAAHRASKTLDPISEGDAAKRRRRGLDQIVDRAGRDAMDVGFPADVCGHRPLRGSIIRLRADDRSPRSVPFRRCAAVPERPGSTSPCAASGWRARPGRRASPNHALGSRCDG